jgi:hypothetical protein
MNAEQPFRWRAFSRQAGFRLVGDSVEVLIESSRRQSIDVEENADGSLLLRSEVAKPSILRQLRTPLLDAWHRNRFSEFVDFSLDRRGRLVGETSIPPTSLSDDEWVFYVTNLAKACDRFEYLLTGADES